MSTMLFDTFELIIQKPVFFFTSSWEYYSAFMRTVWRNLSLSYPPTFNTKFKEQIITVPANIWQILRTD